MAMRLWTNYVTTLANSSEQTFDFPTEDDYRVRHVKTLFVGITTAGVAVAVYVKGQEFSLVDCTRFAAGDSPLKLEFDAPAGIRMQVSVKDIAGGAHTNIPIIVGYEPDPIAGP